MQITRLAILRFWATTAIFVALGLMGIASCQSLAINQFPNVAIPVVTITTTYPGANPQEIEAQVTRPIEDAVSGLANLDQIASTSGEGFSAVTVVFTDAADADRISTDVERQVSTVANGFPEDAGRPSVLKLDLNQVPVMQLALTDDSLQPEQLYELADEQVLPFIERLNGVSRAELVGGARDEILVEVDPIRLATYGVSLQQVQAALASANTSVPGGSVGRAGQQYDLQVSGRMERPEELGEVQVAGGVRVADVATVSRVATEQSQVTRVNGQQAILIAIGQSTGSNLTDVTDAVRANLDDARSGLPATSALVVVQDNTPFVRESILGIQEELALAVILTSVILLMFLHKWRAAGIVLLSIPATLLATFIAMQLLGFSLNFLSLLALTLTIGILVDDSIVVLENILRRLARGEPPFQAALQGRAEIGLAAVAITLVDVAVFAPTALVSGQIGGFFREFGLTIAAATLISLAVSFTLTPMLAAHFLKSETPDDRPPRGLQRFGVWWDRGFARLELRYAALLRWSLRHRMVVVSGAMTTMVAGILLLTSGRIGVEFIPVADYVYFFVETEAPPGTSLDSHDDVIRDIEAVLGEMPEVQTVTSSVGVSGAGVFGSGSTGQARFGSIVVETVPEHEGRRDVFEIADDARARLATVAGAQINVSAVQDDGSGQAIVVRLSGPELERLTLLATEMTAMMEQTPGLLNVSNGAPTGRQQLLVQVDQARAADAGVNASTIGLTVRAAVAGTVATTFRETDGTFTDVRLQLREDARDDIGGVGDLPVQTATGGTIPLRQVSTIREATSPAQIDRQDRERVIVVGADLETGVALSEVQPLVTQAIEDLGLPAGYRADLAGATEQQTEAFGDLFLALGASVLLAYLLMAVLYNSLVHPLVIMFSLPVAVGGAMFGLYAFGYAFSVFSMIGLILLVGLATKNGILLVDRTNQNRARGMSTYDALLEAGPARLRAIMMTSITIALALLPIAFNLSTGAELRAPLAATVLGGVISSSLLTLVLVPVMYTLLDGLPRPVAALLRVLGLRRHPVSPPAMNTEPGE
ncbi:MAG: efflux RND transporter permease subunit [Dehalococcoidia bacterium]